MAPVLKLPVEAATLGEGPHWHEKSHTLYYVDLIEGTANKFCPKTNKHDKVKIGNDNFSFIVPVRFRPNTFIGGHGLEIVQFEWDKDNEIKNKTVLATIDEPSTNRINDAKCDVKGRLWLGTMKREFAGFDPAGSFYSYTKSGGLKKHLSNIGISNGIGWNPCNNIMYYIDSLTHKVSSFDFDFNNGTISNQKTIFNLKESNCRGFPDGMTTDNKGNLFVACFGGRAVLNIDPKGKLIQSIEIPDAENVTSLAFGGENYDQLYVTTANFGSEETGKNAGALFKITDLGVKGSPPAEFDISL